MSKSGSRYGRRSNWFKIHCLLQEQQNKANNNNISQNGNAVGSNQSSPNPTQHSGNNNNLLQNDFISSHFLANLYNSYNNNNGSTKSQEIKRISSPSDSGASSADPDESIKMMNNNNNNNFVTKSKNHVKRSNSFSSEKLLEKANSSSNDGYISPVINKKIYLNSSMKPMSPFLPFNLPHSLSSSALSSRTPSTPEYFMLPLPHHIPLTPSPLQKLNYTADNEQQNEPIDLSIRSNKRLCDFDDDDDLNVDDHSHHTSSPSHDVAPALETPKTVPLDLTLMRSS